MARTTMTTSTPVDENTLSLFTQDEDLKPTSSTFNGQSGQTITHNYGNQNYQVLINPTADPLGLLGEIFFIKSDNTVVIYNTGSARGAFDYTILPHA